MNATIMKNSVLATFAVVGSTLANALGGWDTALQTLLIFMAVDYLTGFIVAGVFKKSGKSKTGALESRAGLKGLLRKGALLLVVLVATRLDGLVGGTYMRSGVVIVFCANEGLSILENVGLMGVQYPAFLENALEAMRKKGDEGTK